MNQLLLSWINTTKKRVRSIPVSKWGFDLIIETEWNKREFIAPAGLDFGFGKWDIELNPSGSTRINFYFKNSNYNKQPIKFYLLYEIDKDLLKDGAIRCKGSQDDMKIDVIDKYTEKVRLQIYPYKV